MTDNKKKPETDEIADEELKKVAGGSLASLNVMDNIAAPTRAVPGAVDGLNAANDLVGQMSDLLDELQTDGGSASETTKGS